MNFDKYYRAMLKHEESKEIPKFRKGEIRASSTPFCPLEFLLNFSDGTRTFAYRSDFYMDIGTVVHDRIQFWLPKAKENSSIMFGHWRCLQCKKKVLYEVGPVYCKACGKQMYYDELHIAFKDAPITGHNDGLLLDLDTLVLKNEKDKIKTSNIKSVEVYVLELKTTSKYGCMKLQEPYLKHQLQVSLYTSAIKKLFKDLNIPFKVKGYIVKYISRDNPELTSPDFISEFKDHKFYNITCKIINMTINSILEKKPLKLFTFKPCIKYPEYYQDCKLQSICDTFTKKDFKDMYKQINKDLFKFISYKNSAFTFID